MDSDLPQPPATTQEEDRDRPSAFDKAVQLLTQRTHFRAQLADKLSRRGYPPEEVEAALERLVDLNYLDDRAAAREYASGKLSREPLGRRRLAADLAKRGAPEEVISEVLDDLLPDDDRSAAREAADRWLARRRNPKKPALARYLERRGFSPPAIWGALEAVEWEEEGAAGEPLHG